MKRPAAKTRPNIVFLLADDLGYGDLGLSGNPAVRTPRLDALGREGIALTGHYSASPLCAPARAALLTGRYNHRTGAVDVPSNRGLDRIALSERTIGNVFSEAGYATGLVGKWHNGLHDPRHHPCARGFREFAGFLNGGMDYYQWVLDRNGCPEPSDGRYLTDVFTDEACAFLRRHRHEPFLLWLAYNAPHTPLQAPEDRIQPYRDAGGLSENVCRLYAMVECMDAGIGRVLDQLRTLGLYENTIVVFTSDNGPWLAGDMARYNGPLRGAKGDVWEGGIRVPAILNWPGGLPGAREVGSVTHFCDWAPTLAALAGLDPGRAPRWDGGDLSPVLRGERDRAERPRFWQRNRYAPLPRCNAAMREGDWKLVWPMREGADWKDPADNEAFRVGLTAAHRIQPVLADLPDRPVGPEPAPRLYRVDLDPHEDRDLAAEHPDRVASMTRAWDAWFEEVAGGWPGVYARNTREAGAGPEDSG